MISTQVSPKLICTISPLHPKYLLGEYSYSILSQQCNTRVVITTTLCIKSTSNRIFKHFVQPKTPKNINPFPKTIPATPKPHTLLLLNLMALLRKHLLQISGKLSQRLLIKATLVAVMVKCHPWNLLNSKLSKMHKLLYLMI